MLGLEVRKTTESLEVGRRLEGVLPNQVFLYSEILEFSFPTEDLRRVSESEAESAGDFHPIGTVVHIHLENSVLD